MDREWKAFGGSEARCFFDEKVLEEICLFYMYSRKSSTGGTHKTIEFIPQTL